MAQKTSELLRKRLTDLWRFTGGKAVMTVTAACLMLVIYIGFLVVSNYRSQIALRDGALNRFRLDLEKRAASLGYFFSERKYDLNTLALSSEINSYFFNKALGMSEQYGLKINLYMIQQLFGRTITERQIHGDSIYSRLVLVDSKADLLVDSASKGGKLPSPLLVHNETPQVYLGECDRGRELILSISCMYRREFVGKLIVWLDEETLFNHFVNLNEQNGIIGAGLIDESGRLHCADPMKDESVFLRLKSEPIDKLPVNGFSFFIHRSAHGPREMLLACQPIPNLHLQYFAWMPRENLVGGVAPLHLIIGMGALAAVVLVVLSLILWFSAQNLILRTRFDEAAKQQDLLERKNRQLEEEIQKREKVEAELQVQRSLRMRSDRLRSLGEMAAGIAHELNQPLVGVRGFAELMLDCLDEGAEMPAGDIRRYAQTIVQQSDRMVHIIKHVRMFARDAGRAETAVVDLHDVVLSGLDLLMAQFNSHGILLEKNIADQPLPIKVNAYSVEEVILNLLSNARHAVEQRRAIENGDYQPRICVSAGEQAYGRGCVGFEVEDNGVGIPGDVADRIFDPFFTTKDPDKGTGLGLSICKSIVESFQGRIEFESAISSGTRFMVVFPKHNGQEG